MKPQLQKWICRLGLHSGERKEERLPKDAVLVRYVCPHCYKVIARTLINREGIFELK